MTFFNHKLSVLAAPVKNNNKKTKTPQTKEHGVVATAVILVLGGRSESWGYPWGLLTIQFSQSTSSRFSGRPAKEKEKGKEDLKGTQHIPLASTCS